MNEISKAEIRKRLGNISHLRELLLGDKFEEYNYKLEQYKLKLDNLEINLQQSQSATEENISRLEAKLINKIDGIASNLEKRTKYYNSKTQESQKKLQTELDTLSQYSHDNIDYLHTNFNINTNSLKIEIAKSKSNLDRDLLLLKQQIFGDLEKHLAELDTNKISRGELADVLWELCLKLKETDSNLDLDGAENHEIESEVKSQNNLST